MHSVLEDLRYALRQLLKNPGFALTAVMSLALGIGATTAVFSVVYAALINPYPYTAADRIVRMTVQTKAGPGNGISLNGPQIQQLRKLSVIESVLAMEFRPLTLTGTGLPESVMAVALISNGFVDLGVPTMLGRGLLPSDALDRQDPQPVAVLSYKFWREHYLSSPGVLGKKLELDRKNYVIVGVAAPRFTWYTADVYLPLKVTQDPAATYIVNMRLRRGVSLNAADAALEPLIRQFDRDMPRHFPEDFRVQVEGLNEWVIRGGISQTLYILFGAVVLLLLIGCANVSILLMARGTVRQHELAVRAALGAQRPRIVRQLLTESMLLAAIGSALGVLASYGMVAGIRALLPKYAFAPEVVVRINLPVLWFSVCVALATGIVFGFLPAVYLSRMQLGRMMQTNGRRVAGNVSGRRTHNALIAGQIALTLLLLAGAGSAMKGFVRLMHTSLRYDPHNVMSVPIPLHANVYTTWAERAAYYEQLRQKVSEIPGVVMTAISSNATPPRSGWSTGIQILGQPATEHQMVSANFVNPEYFAILHIQVLQGEIWSETENRNGAHVAVINRTLAQRYFPKGDAIGHSVKIPQIEDRPPMIVSAPNIADSWLQIVGIVDDVRNDGLRDPVKPAVFLPYTLTMWQFTQILVRSDVPPLTLMHAVQTQLAAVNPEQQAFSIVRDLETWIADQPEWQQEHLAVWIFGFLAWLALALAAVGLYSVVSYTLAQRMNEFGIRVAMGAQRAHLVKITFASTLGSVSSGILVGLALTLALNTLLTKWAEDNSRDPNILLAGALLLISISGIACAIPARHASQIDPMTALRGE
jgi:predicted permease